MTKAVLCKFIKSDGSCPKGDACPFAHSAEEIMAEATKRGQLPKSSLCSYFMQGRCTNGAACSYAHGEEEIGTGHNLGRTSAERGPTNLALDAPGGIVPAYNQAPLEQDVMAAAAQAANRVAKGELVCDGKVRNYDVARQSGFIVSERVHQACGHEVYVHRTVLEQAFASPGDTVIFFVHWSQKGLPQASSPMIRIAGETCCALKGIFKRAVSKDFGFIECPVLHYIFQRDVYCSREISAGLESGQLICFNAFLNQDGMPNAEVVQPCDESYEPSVGDLSQSCESKSVVPIKVKKSDRIKAEQEAGKGKGKRKGGDVDGMNMMGMGSVPGQLPDLGFIGGGEKRHGWDGPDDPLRLPPLPAEPANSGLEPGLPGVKSNSTNSRLAELKQRAQMQRASMQGGTVSQLEELRQRAQIQRSGQLQGDGAGGMEQMYEAMQQQMIDSMADDHRPGMPIVGRFDDGRKPNPPKPVGDGRRYIGHIKSFVFKNNYGFIECPETFEEYGRDVYCSGENVAGFQEGDAIEFEVGMNSKNQPQAINVTGPDGAPPPNPEQALNRSRRARERDEGHSGMDTSWVDPGMGGIQPMGHQGAMGVEMCKDFLAGKCTRGNDCRFSHQGNPGGEMDSMQQTLDSMQQATSMMAEQMNQLMGREMGGKKGSKGKGKGKGKERDDVVEDTMEFVTEGVIEGMKAGKESAGSKRRPASTGEQLRGVIKSANISGNYGFIACESVKEQYGRDVYCPGEFLLGKQVGEAVIFELGMNSKGQPQVVHLASTGVIEGGRSQATASGNQKRQRTDAGPGGWDAPPGGMVAVQDNVRQSAPPPPAFPPAPPPQPVLAPEEIAKVEENNHKMSQMMAEMQAMQEKMREMQQQNLELQKKVSGGKERSFID